MLNVEIFTQSCTEFFWKWIVLRELHRGVLLERVSSFRFQVSGFWMLIFFGTRMILI